MNKTEITENKNDFPEYREAATEYTESVGNNEYMESMESMESIETMETIIKPFLQKVKDGDIIPEKNLWTTITEAKDNIFVAEVKGKFNEIQESYLVAYDRNNCNVLSIEECYLENKQLVISFSEDFFEALSEINEEGYARICLAVKHDGLEEMYFLKDKSLDKDKYDGKSGFIGQVDFRQPKSGGFCLYFSKSSLISIKYYSDKEIRGIRIHTCITGIADIGNEIEINVMVPASDSTRYDFYLYSKTKDIEITDFEFSIKDISTVTILRNVITITIDKDFLTEAFYDAYKLVVYIDDVKHEVCLGENLWLDERNRKGVLLNNVGPDEADLFFSYGRYNISDIQFGKKIYEYAISVVIACYNTELFLREALDSILKQKTDNINGMVVGRYTPNYKKRLFRDLYQVILVDDGATDETGAICDEYAEKYENFIVIHKVNGGVSTARNAGIEIAEGKYLNFMDSDDRFSDNVFSECIKYFEDKYDELDMVSFPLHFFDASSGEHWLNTKFDKGTRILDFNTEYDKTQLFVNSSFFKNEIVQNKYRFDSELKTGEDIKFIYSILFDNTARIGLVNKCKYWYRRRSIGELSAIQASKTDRNFYFGYLTNCMDSLIEESIRKFGFVTKYVQYLVAQQLQWRFVEDKDASIALSIITEEEFAEYKEHIKKELQYISPEIILEQKKLYKEQKKYILETRNPDTVVKHFTEDDILYSANGIQIARESESYSRLEFIKIRNGKLFLEGYCMSFEKDAEVFITVNGTEYPVEKEDRDNSVYSLGESIFHAVSFRVMLTLPEDETITIGIIEKISGNVIKKNVIRYAKTAPLSQTYNKSYYYKEKWIVRQEKAKLVLKNITYSKNIMLPEVYEKEFIKQIASKAKTKVEKEAIEFRKKIISMRNSYLLSGGRRVWLISDRVNIAGDNGEALFIYLSRQNIPDTDIYFVIDNKSRDYLRMKKYGNVVVQNSEQHKILHMVADYIISSQANEYVLNPFYDFGTTEYFRDVVYTGKFVFLQHGITKDDVSDWLNRFKKDMTGLIAAAVPEYEAFLGPEYFYTKKEIWLTGFPRHDRLYHDEKKYITIMPTWRQYLAMKSPKDPNVNVLKPGFEYSDFFKFYNTLINDERLIDAAERTGYTICFMPHPNIMNNLNLFEHNPKVKFFGTDKPYREIYAESDLVMTDYSSAVMDFAYLRKPIVYCHFDYDDFFAGDHVYTKGYFDYEEDGFGEVTYDESSLVDIMIEYMENNCQLKKKYFDRMEGFFGFNDKGNCERVYKKLLENED